MKLFVWTIFSLILAVRSESKTPKTEIVNDPKSDSSASIQKLLTPLSRDVKRGYRGDRGGYRNEGSLRNKGLGDEYYDYIDEKEHNLKNEGGLKNFGWPVSFNVPNLWGYSGQGGERKSLVSSSYNNNNLKIWEQLKNNWGRRNNDEKLRNNHGRLKINEGKLKIDWDTLLNSEGRLANNDDRLRNNNEGGLRNNEGRIGNDEVIRRNNGVRLGIDEIIWRKNDGRLRNDLGRLINKEGRFGNNEERYLNNGRLINNEDRLRNGEIYKGRSRDDEGRCRNDKRPLISFGNLRNEGKPANIGPEDLNQLNVLLEPYHIGYVGRVDLWKGGIKERYNVKLIGRQELDLDKGTALAYESTATSTPSTLSLFGLNNGNHRNRNNT